LSHQIFQKVSILLNLIRVKVDTLNETAANISGEPNDSMLNGLCDDDVLDNEQMPSDEEDGEDNPELLAQMESR